MTDELMTDLIEHDKAIARISGELEELAARLAWLCKDVADLKRGWPAAHIIVVDEANVN
jgi:hypothetical protein